MNLKDKKILLGVSGSIAAYKTAMLVRLLVKEGAKVKVIMTHAATDFVTPLTLSTLSRNEVLYELSDNATWANHVMLGRWADIMLIAPLSCNTLSKMAHGICDNLLMAVYLSATCPVAVAPAMDEDMWKHASTTENRNKINSFGNMLLPVNNGELASGLIGEGRMAEPEEILRWLLDYFHKKNELSGKNVLITAGPTYEHIDPVRFIGNYSSGKMGIALAVEAVNRGANVTLVLGPTFEPVPNGIDVIRVKSATEMFEQCTARFSKINIAILSAAVADYAPVKVAKEKIKKTEDHFELGLQKTPDILKTLGSQKKAGQFLVGFALETNNEKENALKKLKQKNADIIVLNSLADKGSGFGHNSNKITIFDNNGKELAFELKPKKQVAKDIIDTIISYTHE
ncbi:MAG: bifunctional phosphopantothenoylcysteine decarboxylase/phosphopantothenate--cysteine ligase CoaBC [Chitinophagaceae bacterium]|jgi:phosphopantothenoylcysteine decarboxylase/phosphopantothenate--cysteine ligase|nr:bifunctional phosphopantothenoylcysteine decarboxylase/phosphopantothenate--cysteine ligase CoaBC [Chitinophagaceae bacterium]MBP6046896.1 bifunctional phosphopantothenoylcysteine decarboxylase/phosphopantothenate--cysteine ligase CoaBC [Ferruginibacter sp.]NMD29194.1 bifunctional phosphopantothenoylcysteine decarboxylase/phosphopantothenate--cysteine ligase CoaBC [Bacteroidota bacterium]MBK7089500.1 bifunctional phosphopantothenoylcysteine decarboxylase/phosphopantothenate--cysteine ligase C